MLALFTAVGLLSQAAAAQPPADSSPLPRTAWGEPDLQGIWDFRTLTPLERPLSMGDKSVLTDAEAAAFEREINERLDMDRRDGGSRFDVERAYNAFWYDFGHELTADHRTSLIVDPPNGRIPPLTEAARQETRARRRERKPPIRERVLLGAATDGPEHLGLSERCLLGFNAGPPMLPSAYNNNVKIFQTPEYVVLLNEMIHDARIVPLDGRPLLPPSVHRWMGDSRGRWEGETLVVETTNFTDKTAFSTIQTGALGSGDTLHLVERFTRIDGDTMLYEFTIEDPQTFTQPWTAALPMRATDGPIFEYACHEANYAMSNLLAAARAVEPSDTPDGPNED